MIEWDGLTSLYNDSSLTKEAECRTPSLLRLNILQLFGYEVLQLRTGVSEDHESRAEGVPNFTNCGGRGLPPPGRPSKALPGRTRSKLPPGRTLLPTPAPAVRPPPLTGAPTASEFAVLRYLRVEGCLGEQRGCRSPAYVI